MTVSLYVGLVSSAAQTLKERKEEVNRLNVFPVPDGDTGTNMSLTMDVVVAEVGKLGDDANLHTIAQAITHGSLMGARGNSGVILSQILRGLCEGAEGATEFDAEAVAKALERSVVVAFQAVRKPVEGTILTVLRDTAEAARRAANDGAPIADALTRISAAAFESVRRTPELLPVLKESGVVDAGGFGLAILIEGFVAGALGAAVHIEDVSSASAPLMGVVPVDDWDDSEYLYCTEFLLYGDNVDPALIEEYVSSQGGSELVVGSDGEYKVHVHTNNPGAVLQYMTVLGEVAEVHVNNMRRQTEARDRGLKAENAAALAAKRTAPAKPIGFVAVAAGDGLAEILHSLGADVVVSGGQTMNPSTQELLEAIESVHADKVIVLPNNKNIVMAANAAASVASRPTVVVPTTSVPQSFSAMLAVDGGQDLDVLASAMTEAAEGVRSGEVTTAVKDAKGKAGDIKTGDIIGISEHEIEIIGSAVGEVSVRLAGVLLADGAETLTVLAGEDLSDPDLEALAEELGKAYPDVDIETHRGGQPLYPVILAAE
ncbi:MAG: DAK2 domain-containing protein [Coriobacteriia bacterium]|nr:DAK2 domain-containing protein [Coriobacteriia bacterium]